MTSVLFSAIRLADLELANRIVVAPMSWYAASSGAASDWPIKHYGLS
jgi:2,4-dienoyl-CoA reductase-like NADH-dependent reductase (Old Yellow Enzyme family)